MSPPKTYVRGPSEDMCSETQSQTKDPRTGYCQPCSHTFPYRDGNVGPLERGKVERPVRSVPDLGSIRLRTTLRKLGGPSSS